MNRLLLPLAAGIAMLAGATPALAQQTAAEYFRARASTSNIPTVLSDGDRTFYARVFNAIDGGDWSTVESLLAQRGDEPLKLVAQAEYYLDANSPRIELPALQAWLARGSRLPQAQQITDLALKRGLMSAPYLPPEQSFLPQGYASKRVLPRDTSDGTMPGDIKAAILDRISNDDPDGARLLLDGVDAGLSSEARAEWRRRVAWSYYIENDDAAALAMARTVREGSGPWVPEGDWVVGIAAWRMGDCVTAADGFTRAAAAAINPELSAASYYWASRAHVRCREPEKAAEMLRGAAMMDETLYGMLAREQLGQQLPRAGETPDLDARDWQMLSSEENVRVAVALAELGHEELADEVLRHQARIGDPSKFAALSRLARELGLPSTQLWMAHNAPRGGTPDPALRFPVARWEPVTGWQVDPALAYAHALQESNFRAAVVSPAGARGLMQIMPAAAQDHAGSLGVSGNARSLNQPSVNLAFGQRHLQMLRDHPATQGKLPKVMAAYNAGLTPVGRWNGEVNDQGDPLLYMESIPYWETRGYVAIVTRNYWMYERQAAAPSPSRQALAMNRWPGFPEASQVNPRFTSR
ncbi:MAG: lytic transglycosylase domain-containing protein [Erythrobacter sp.]|nr:lytic transglycosylase domain-containing protein [Erythrobacter sp.]NCQ63980.1 lytic transglycosylase domain-containing protein [Alphaproteobacteria bacterium]